MKQEVIFMILSKPNHTKYDYHHTHLTTRSITTTITPHNHLPYHHHQPTNIISPTTIIIILFVRNYRSQNLRVVMIVLNSNRSQQSFLQF
ncbi:hypothetical protein Patl1_32444 [Pistacia atlantica]|uniref:Uncharacterized protein n=1 Tax=Pistacia atlantica TaxID=434234 RepID=A0ACC1ANA9_9ROSI|nr:hypothetical protein Patl1_32444 [Pistacia atlantica]